jgi:hypothetical protein
MRTKMSEMASACDADALLAKLQETHQFHLFAAKLRAA